MVELVDLVAAAIEARSHALTFRSSVGVAFETFDGKVYTGFNIETYGHKGEHAEEVGLMRLAADGYMGTDVRRMVEVFQDAGHDDVEIFPACPTCWARLQQFLHPYLEIVVADIEGRVHWTGTMRQMFDGLTALGAEVYPSNKVRIAKPLKNFKPRLPLAPQLRDAAMLNDDFRVYCDAVLGVW